MTKPSRCSKKVGISVPLQENSNKIAELKRLFSIIYAEENEEVFSQVRECMTQEAELGG